MADILTQIQDELDHFLNQMKAGMAYIKHRSPPSVPPGQPVLSSFAEYEASQNPSQPTQNTTTDPSQPSDPSTTAASNGLLPNGQYAPATPSEFQSAISELSRDLVIKEQQLEVLIERLPGIERSEAQQVERMRELERELEGLEEERVGAVREKEELIKEVERRIRGMSGGS